MVLYSPVYAAVVGFTRNTIDPFNPFIVSIPCQLRLAPVLLLVVILSNHRLHAISLTLLMIIFGIIILINPLLDQQGPDITDLAPPGSGWDIALRTSFPMMSILLLILLSVAPAKAISRRLIFLALGLLLLIALNELSKLGGDISWLKPPS